MSGFGLQARLPWTFIWGTVNVVPALHLIAPRIREMQARGQALSYKYSDCNPESCDVLGLNSLPYTLKETRE